tara:strand:+ start:3737 stop:4243 length:507 start_codon:yes stop_codon:yes gene_type:complete
MNSKTGHNIKKRNKANDVFITPLTLAKKHIDMIEYKDDDIWYDPFKNSGNYYNQFPNDNKVWSEILEGEDFFDFNMEVDIICSNPPYSMINEVLSKCISLKPRVISLLIGQGNLTTKRIENMNKAGYGLYKLRMLKVHDWYGMSYIVHFEKDKENCVEIDRTIYYREN